MLDEAPTEKDRRIQCLEKELKEKKCINNGLNSFIEEQYRVIDAKDDTINEQAIRQWEVILGSFQVSSIITGILTYSGAPAFR